MSVQTIILMSTFAILLQLALWLRSKLCNLTPFLCRIQFSFGKCVIVMLVVRQFELEIDFDELNMRNHGPTNEFSDSFCPFLIHRTLVVIDKTSSNKSYYRLDIAARKLINEMNFIKIIQLKQRRPQIKGQIK